MDEEKIIAEVIVKPFMKCERMVTFHFYDENACKVLATFARGEFVNSGSSVKNRKNGENHGARRFRNLQDNISNEERVACVKLRKQAKI
jgi:hypothetical protein